MTKKDMQAYIKKLEEALRWYIENDDTNNTPYNAYWWENKIKAMQLLGMEDES